MKCYDIRVYVFEGSCVDNAFAHINTEKLKTVGYVSEEISLTLPCYWTVFLFNFNFSWIRRILWRSPTIYWLLLIVPSYPGGMESWVRLSAPGIEPEPPAHVNEHALERPTTQPTQLYLAVVSAPTVHSNLSSSDGPQLYFQSLTSTETFLF